MRGRRYRVGQIPEVQAAVVGAMVRVLRQRNGWTQAKIGELMGGGATPPCAPPKVTAMADSAGLLQTRSSDSPTSSASSRGSS